MAGPQPNGRNSEGVVTIRHPRSDFPQQGWIRKATGTFYEAVSGFGWYSSTQSYGSNYTNAYARRIAASRAYYQTQPNVVTFHQVISGFGWWSQTQVTGRTDRHPARDLNNWDQDDQNFDFISLSQVFDPATHDWGIDTSRTASGKTYLRDTPITSSWIFPNLPAAFDPATHDWGIDSQRITNTREPVTSYLRPNYFIAVFPDPAIQDWHIDTVRTSTNIRYQRDSNVNISWVFQNLPAAPYDPAPNDWHIDTTRTVTNRKYQRDTNVDLSWISGTFDQIEAVYAGVAQLQGLRTPQRSKLDVRLYASLYDLSWLHDVIPLTDPPPVTSTLKHRHVCGNSETGFDDWTISYQG